MRPGAAITQETMMADAVTTRTVYNGKKRHAVHITNESDGTGEAAVAKVDISTLTDPNGQTCRYTVMDMIEYSVQGFNYVTLSWDHDNDDVIAILSGTGLIDWRDQGGLPDPSATGGAGDIIVTTDGAADGDSYDITMHFRAKA